MAQVTSRAFSWPMNPAATGSASPASLRPRPLTCECDAMRSVLVVDLTSSIFILHVTTESATQTVRQSLSGTRLRRLRLRARGHGCRRREEGTRSLDSAPCRSMAPETGARGNDACIHAKMGRAPQRNSSRGGEPPPRTFQRRRAAVKDLEKHECVTSLLCGKGGGETKNDVGGPGAIALGARPCDVIVPGYPECRGWKSVQLRPERRSDQPTTVEDETYSTWLLNSHSPQCQRPSCRVAAEATRLTLHGPAIISGPCFLRAPEQIIA